MPSPPPPSPAAPRVLIVGAGVVGLCTALALAARGARVTLLDRGLPGAANSTLTGGGIRQQFGTEAAVRLSLAAAPFWETFEARFGVDPLFRSIGYLFLANTQAEARGLDRQVALQRGLGVDSERLDTSMLERRWPALAGRGFVAAAFRQADGWANQHRILDGLTRGAHAAGVEVVAGAEALSLRVRSGCVEGVRTTAGDFCGDAVVLATGAWGQALWEPLGLRLPIAAHRHELLIVEPTRPLPRDLPWLIGIADQVHLRPDAPGRALVGGFLGHDNPGDADSWSREADPAWSRKVRAVAARAFGVISPDAPVRHGWAGLYPSTPDRLPIVDRLHEGLYGILGLSGAGLMHAPAVAEHGADLVMEPGTSGQASFAAHRFGPGDCARERTGF